MKKILSRPNFLPLVIVVAFGLLAGRQLLAGGYFNMHDDLQMMRQLEMEKCFLDGQIPCRWVPDMGYGFGFPLFNFYPPLPYLFGQVVRTFGFSFVTAVKITFLVSFLASGAAMYFLAKEFFGRFGGAISAIFYIWAPYHAVDIYVRGAMNEAWALIWFPLILWAGYRLIGETKRKTPWVIGLALAWAGLLVSHNLMALIFAPVFAGWCLLWVMVKKNLVASIKPMLTSGVLALGLAAFFTLPAALEQKYVQVNTLVTGYYEYIAHFADINQLLLSRFWGYGPSIWGENDGMPFQVGHVHWLLSIIIIGFVLFGLLKSKLSPSRRTAYSILLFLFAVGWFSAFMAHSRSTPIWQMLPPLKFVQFPWRFLTLITLAFSFMAGSVTLLLPKKWAYSSSVILIGGLIVLNWNYFRPEHMGPLTDKQKFTGAAWELQQTAGIYDYLPKDAITAPKEPRKNVAEVMTGKGNVANEASGTNWAKFQLTAESSQTTARINIFKFPSWRILVDGKEINPYIDKNEAWGRMYIDVPEGVHEVSAKLVNTPIRTAANIISLFTWIGLIGFIAIRRFR